MFVLEALLNPFLIPVIAASIIIVIALFFIIKTATAPRRTEEIERLTEDCNYQAAIKLGKKLIAKDDRNFLARYYLGRTYIACNKYDIAMETFEYLNKNATFSKSFSEIDFRHDMAKLYEHFDQTEEALKEYIMLTKLESNNDDNFFNAGRLFESINKLEQALKYYTLAVQLNNKNADAHAAIGILHYNTKQMIDAKEEIEKAIKISPRTYKYYYYLGLILKYNHSYPEAVDAFEKASSDTLFKQKALLERGICFIEVQNYEKAVIELERAISITADRDTNETLHARYYLAQCYENLRNLDNAIKQWEIIAKAKRNFKDVNAKLEKYHDLQTNDLMKDYLTNSAAEFTILCQNLTLSVFGMIATDIQPDSGGLAIKALPSNDNSGKDNRMQQTLFYYFRENTPVDENFLRRTLENMKKSNIGKCVVCTTASFTSSAVRFADGRPFELIDQQKLDLLLKNAS